MTHPHLAMDITITTIVVTINATMTLLNIIRPVVDMVVHHQQRQKFHLIVVDHSHPALLPDIHQVAIIITTIHQAAATDQHGGSNHHQHHLLLIRQPQTQKMTKKTVPKSLYLMKVINFVFFFLCCNWMNIELFARRWLYAYNNATPRCSFQKRIFVKAEKDCFHDSRWQCFFIDDHHHEYNGRFNVIQYAIIWTDRTIRSGSTIYLPWFLWSKRSLFCKP